jgi:hypothetical protein
VNKNYHWFLFFQCCFACSIIISCANQQPPGGGEDDKIPPKILSVFPENNTTNFSDDKVIILFNEYVDKRSFIDAIRISPVIKTDIEYNWSGKEVEISFQDSPKKLKPNTTFLITLNTNLKDIYGNQIVSPITIAFSTGNKIDECSISGKVVNSMSKIISIFAYKISSFDYNFDPVLKLPDYIIETSIDGNYKLSNLAIGKYRLIAVEDDDKNLLYTIDRENFGLLPKDVEVYDSVTNLNNNFYLKKIDDKSLQIDQSKFFKDSLNIISSSVKSNSSISSDQSIFLGFRNFSNTREQFQNSFKFTQDNGILARYIANWRNDSLVEIFPVNGLPPASNFIVTLSIKFDNDSLYNYSLKFKTYSLNSYGDLKGRIILNDSQNFSNTYILIFTRNDSTNVSFQQYKFEIKDSVFSVNKIIEGDYSLFAFEDINNNSLYDYGSLSPFSFAEKFFIYPQKILAKGGWAVENIVVNFQ